MEEMREPEIEEEYKRPCQYSVRLISKLSSLDAANILDYRLINKSIYWAKKYHGTQIRKSGEPFYSHPLEVAYRVSDHLLTTNVIIASILHDIVEDTDVTVGMIVDNFSWRVAQMVDRLTRDRPCGQKLSVKDIIYNAFEVGDREVMLIKLFDRMHNLLTLSHKPFEKQRKTALESLEQFTVLSMFFENNQIFDEIKKICMPYLKAYEGGQ